MKFKYTEEQLRSAIESSGSIRQVLSKLGLKEAGGNYETIKRRISKLNIDTSHFHGQAHLKGKTHDYTKKPIEFYLTENSHHQSYKLKYRLISEGIKGNHYDNRLPNLRLLCPNCHAQTETYRGKNKK